MEKTDVLILGSGIAAVSAAEAAHKQNPNLDILICTADQEMPYYRLWLPDRLCDHDKNLCMHPLTWYDEQAIRLKQDVFADQLLADKKQVHFHDGTIVEYGSLVIATGSSSFIPPIPGIHGKHIHTLWTVEDTERILSDMEEDTKVVVIGGGLLGLETAHKLHAAGAKVTILESFERLVGRQTDNTASTLFRNRIESLGIDVFTSANTKEIRDTESGKVVELADGRILECDIIIVSTGVKANVEWLKDSGLQIDRRICVNKKMESNIDSIYAAGDVATQDGLWFGLWAVSKAQGHCAGVNAAGGQAEYILQIPPYILNTMDSSIVSAGLYPDEKQAYEESELNEEEFTYKRVIYASEDKEGPVLGYILLGKKYTRESMGLLKRLVR